MNLQRRCAMPKLPNAFVARRVEDIRKSCPAISKQTHSNHATHDYREATGSPEPRPRELADGGRLHSDDPTASISHRPLAQFDRALTTTPGNPASRSQAPFCILYVSYLGVSVIKTGRAHNSGRRGHGGSRIQADHLQRHRFCPFRFVIRKTRSPERLGFLCEVLSS